MEGLMNSLLSDIKTANEKFIRRIDLDNLPVQRTPGRLLIVTCMDPRVNLESVGVEPFGADGSCNSDVRVIRTIGGMAETRSLIIGIHLAGIKQIVIMMHTDCGCCAAWSKADAIIASMETTLGAEELIATRALIGEPFGKESLRKYLFAFDNPIDAVKNEVERIRVLPFVPKDVAIYGLIYELATGKVEVVAVG
jgi:carbonic anhydrase